MYQNTTPSIVSLRRSEMNYVRVAQGSAVGATCAVLALIAIVSGKYMYISHHHEQLMTLLGDGGAEALFEDMFPVT